MSASVRVPTILRTYTDDAAEVTAKGATLAEILDDLEANYPGIRARILDDDGKVRRFVNVYVGDEDVRFDKGLQTEVAEGAQVSIIPAVGPPSGWSRSREGAGTTPFLRGRRFPCPKDPASLALIT